MGITIVATLLDFVGIPWDEGRKQCPVDGKQSYLLADTAVTAAHHILQEGMLSWDPYVP